MDDLPRQKLAELVRRYGPEIAGDARRCEALLRDACPQHKREIVVLVSAAKESVGIELLNNSSGVPKEVLLSRLAKRLHDNLGMAEDFAQWAVESWALALGIASPNDFRFPFKCPRCGATGGMARQWAGQRVNCPNCKATLCISSDGRNIVSESDEGTPKHRARSAAQATFQGTSVGDVAEPLHANRDVAFNEEEKAMEAALGFARPTDTSDRRLRCLFEHATKMMAQENYDYAAELFTHCVLGDPTNVNYLQGFINNLRKKYHNNKNRSFLAPLKELGPRAALKRALSAGNWVEVVKNGLTILKVDPWDVRALEEIQRAIAALAADKAAFRTGKG